MTIEIKELIIRATITDGSETPEAPAKGGDGDVDEEDIVSECVEKVLKVLERRKER